ncbi:MAG: gamma-glutamyltransferase [Planctomycetaceae bacterium]
MGESLSRPDGGCAGTIAGLAEAHRLYGSLPWRVLVEPSVALAEQGFIVDDYLAYSLNSLLVKKSVREDERYAELRRVLGHPDGKPWQQANGCNNPIWHVRYAASPSRDPRRFTSDQSPS